MGLSHPLTDARTLLRYALGESTCSVAGRRPEMVGHAVPVSVLDAAERGACPNMVLAPPATSRALLPGFTLQPLGDVPLLAFLAGAAPPGLLAALWAFFPLEEAAPGDLLGEVDGPEARAGDLDLGLELDADEDDEYLLN